MHVMFSSSRDYSNFRHCNSRMFYTTNQWGTLNLFCTNIPTCNDLHLQHMTSPPRAVCVLIITMASCWTNFLPRKYIVVINSAGLLLHKKMFLIKCSTKLLWSCHFWKGGPCYIPSDFVILPPTWVGHSLLPLGNGIKVDLQSRFKM